MELGRCGWVAYARPLARLQASTGTTLGQRLLLDPVELLDQDGEESADGGAEALGSGRRARFVEDATTTGVKEEKKNGGEGKRKEEKAGVTRRSVAHRSKWQGARA